MMNRQPHSFLAAAFAMALAVTGCGGDAESNPGSPSGDSSDASETMVSAVIDPGDGGSYSPVIDAADFVDVIDNPFMPYPVGAHWRYEGQSDGEVEVIDITVTGERRMVMGVSAFVVRDTVTIGGQLVEDTYDWFAQDSEGNVWYLGEDVKDYENGKLVSTAGSWEAGVDGALPGIVMPAAPAVGDAYRQEFYAGEAEDMMKITAVGAALAVGAGSFDDVVTTHDWSPLDPDTVEEKSYARGVGKIREVKIAGGDGFAELVEYSIGT
jgi:hypothetical protein